MARKIAVEITGDASSLERSFRRAEASSNGFNREIGRSVRGAAAGSGVFKGLGRSIAFASGGFLAFASAGELLRKSIDAATENAAVQRQLAAQFKANKQSLAQYTTVIDEHTLAVSRLSGFNETELTQSFTTAFRASKNVSQSLTLQSAAANAARGTGKDLSVVTLALTKALTGQSGALRRLGILVPPTLHGIEAINFVQQKFAGQAQAGTTAQQRFGAAIHNTEVTLGRALLPTLTSVLNSATKWLDSQKHQKEISDKVNKTVSTGGKILHTFGHLAEGVIKPTEQVAHALDKVSLASRRLNRALASGFKGGTGGFLKQVVTGEDVRLLGVANAVARTGEDVGLGGAGARQETTPGKNVSKRARASLDYQINLENLRLLKDQVKGSKAAERADLVRLKALTEEKIAKTKDLAKRTTLYQSLGSVTQQIAQIDSQAAADRKTAADKALAARKKAAAEALKQKQKEVEAARKEAAKIKAAESHLRAVMASLHQAFNTALDSARSQIGDLFQGPVLNPSAAQTKQLLGVPGPTVGGLTRDVVAQTRQAKRFNHDLARLRKQALAGGLSKGDTNELIKEMRAQGTAGIPQIEAITGAGAGARAKFLAGFAGREQFAHRVAQMTVQARTVHISTSKVPIEVTVNLDGKSVAKVVTTHQDRAKGRTASQTRGRHGGR